MPVAPQPPYIGLGSIIDQQDERLRSTESIRIGIQGIYDASATHYVTTSNVLAKPSGWPILTFTLGPTGCAIVGGQFQSYTASPSTSYGITVGCSFDSGSIITIGSGETGINNTFSPAAGYYLFSGTPSSSHTFQLAAAAPFTISVSTTFGEPFLVAKPF